MPRPTFAQIEAEAPGRQEAIRRGDLRHSLLNDEYWQAMFRAEYYRWATTKGFVTAGGDPFDGRLAKARQFRELDRAEGRAVHAVQARFWLRHAATLRARMTSVLPEGTR